MNWAAGTLDWSRRHKFWASVIALWCLAVVLSPNPVVATHYGQIVGVYTFFGAVAKLTFFRNKRKEVKSK